MPYPGCAMEYAARRDAIAMQKQRRSAAHAQGEGAQRCSCILRVTQPRSARQRAVQGLAPRVPSGKINYSLGRASGGRRASSRSLWRHRLSSKWTVQRPSAFVRMPRSWRRVVWREPSISASAHRRSWRCVGPERARLVGNVIKADAPIASGSAAQHWTS